AAADRDRVADDARAATTQARFTGLLVVALPAGAALFAELLQPGFISRVLSEPASAAMLVAAGGLPLAGLAGLRRLGRPEEVRSRSFSERPPCCSPRRERGSWCVAGPALARSRDRRIPPGHCNSGPSPQNSDWRRGSSGRDSRIASRCVP